MFFRSLRSSMFFCLLCLFQVFQVFDVFELLRFLKCLTFFVCVYVCEMLQSLICLG